MASNDGGAGPTGAAETNKQRAARRGKRTALSAAAIVILVPLTVALAALGEAKPALLRVALYNIAALPPRATLLTGFVGGFAIAALFALAKPLARRRIGPFVAALPPALITAGTWAACARFLPDPLASAPDLTFGARAAQTSSRLVGVASLVDIGLAFAALALGLAALVVRPQSSSASAGKRSIAALVVAAISLPATATLIVRGFHVELGSNITAPWVAALPAGFGLIAVVLGSPAVQTNDADASSRLLCAAASALAGVFLAAHALLAGTMPALAGLPPELVEQGMHEMRNQGRALSLAGLTFTLPIILTTLVAMPSRAFVAALRRLRPLSIILTILALSPLWLLIRVEPILHRISRFAGAEKHLHGSPGALVPDPDLPQGTLLVDLAGLSSPGNHLLPTTPARVFLDEPKRAIAWTPDAPARFEGLTVGQHELGVEGEYLVEPVRVAWPDQRVGARLMLPVLPLLPKDALPARMVATGGEPTHIEYFEIDTTPSDGFVVRYIQNSVVVFLERAPREAAKGEALSYPALEQSIRKAWQARATHRDEQDRNLDVAVIRVRKDARLSEVRAVAGHLLAVQRDVRRRGWGQAEPSSVFEILVALPRAARPRPIDVELLPLEASLPSLTPADAVPRLTEALSRCRSAPCTPALHARLWVSLGGALVMTNRAAEALVPFLHARALDPEMQLAEGAQPEILKAFEESTKKPLPKVVPSEPRISGQLPTPEVDARLAVVHAEVRSCYMNALEEAPTLAGTMEYRLIVGRDGVVGYANVDGKDLPESLVSCVERMCHVLSFPEPTQGIVTVQQSLELSPQEETKPAPVAGAAGGGGEDPY